MAPTTSVEQMEVKVQQSLEGSPYAATSLTKLSGGTANFIYRASLVKPLEDTIHEVLVKHGEAFIANNPNFQLNDARCRLEQECLESLSTFSVVGNADPQDAYRYTVRTPKVYQFDGKTNTQIQELLPKGVDLKNYALKNYPSPTPESMRSQCQQLGKSLGRWLREFHDWSKGQAGLRKTLAKNYEMQKLKHMINYDWLFHRVDQFPHILTEAKDVLEEVRKMAAKELEDESQLQVIHGDFWTGNALIPNEPVQEGVETSIFIIDWEMAQLGVRNLDIGQMIAELYELWLFKSIKSGLWIIEGLVEAYGKVDESFAFRTAIQVGAHLVSFGTVVPGWGTPEQVEMVAKTGRDIIVNGWKKNRPWFEKGELACLFKTVA